MPSTSSVPEHDLPIPAEKTYRAISMVWLIPLVAGAIAIWLAYTTLAEQGPTVAISFKTAEGLEPGKTKVKYRDVDVGMVTAVKLANDLSHIVVSAQMAKEMAPHMNDGTRFWIVRPRVGTGGISGLSTLVSGAFVEVDPGKGEKASEYVGLEEPPLIASDIAGREFVLRAEELNSIYRGSPIQFHGLEVGEVLGYELHEDGKGIKLHAFIEEPYDQLVTEQTRFWNVSGIDIDVNAEGVSFSTDSLQSLLVGGIAFDTPLTAATRIVAEAGREFPLYDSFDNVTEAAFSESVPYLLHFEGSVRGLHAGSPVEFRGIKVGRVAEVRLVYDIIEESLKIPVVIELEPARVDLFGEMPMGSMDDPAGIEEQHHSTMVQLVGQGLRAQLVSGNLLTGGLIVSLDFHEDQPKAYLNFDRPFPEIPSIPSDLEGLAQTATDVLDQIASLPIAAIGADVSHILQGVDALVSSPDTQQSVETLSAALNDVRALLAKVDSQADPLLAALLKALESADLTLARSRSTLTATEGLVGESSKMRRGLNSTLKEISGAARSIRIFADYLERHPEALLRGK